MGNEQPRCIKQTVDGGYIVGSTSNSEMTGDKTDSCHGVVDFWIIKLDKSGKIEWDKTIGGNDYDAVEGIEEIKKNNFVIAGISRSGKNGDKTDESRGEEDYWIVYLNK